MVRLEFAFLTPIDPHDRFEATCSSTFDVVVWAADIPDVVYDLTRTYSSSQFHVCLHALKMSLHPCPSHVTRDLVLVLHVDPSHGFDMLYLDYVFPKATQVTVLERNVHHANRFV